MKVGIFFSLLSIAVLAAQARGSDPLATEASPSFRLKVKKGSRSVACGAVMLTALKSERCFAVTARDCLITPEEKVGRAIVSSAELGELTADYFLTPGDAALLSWRCTRSEYNIPGLYLSDYYTDEKLGPKTAVKYGRTAPASSSLPPQLGKGEVAEGNAAQTHIKTPGYELGREDLGQPLLCPSDMGTGPVSGGAVLCGVLVSPERSRFATGEAMTFVRAKMKALGVPDPQFIIDGGRKYPLIDK